MSDTQSLKLNILVAEDNKVNQMVARKLLDKLGCQCSIAEDGAKAIEILNSGSFDAILMDIMMPVMDGIEATKQIRASDKDYSQIPIIAFTASVDDKDKDSCLSAGMNGFLSKPATVEQLTDALSSLQ